MLRTISEVVRHRICKRAPLTHATCVAAGEGTESVVACGELVAAGFDALNTELTFELLRYFYVFHGVRAKTTVLVALRR